MRLDAHHHFWNYSPEAYPWISEGMDPLKADFSPTELAPLLENSGLDGVISVQARTSLEENDFLLDCADQNPFIKGVVGWVDPTQATVARDLERYASHRKFRGVREVLQGKEDDAYCLRSDFNRGIAELKNFGLAYDILIFHRHLGPTTAFVDRHPEQIFILDHIAKPSIASTIPDPVWAAQIGELAKRKNVYCKLSGLVTEITTQAVPSDNLDLLLHPYFLVVLEAFGPERLMFGSDWPVCLLRTDYVAWAKLVQQWLSPLSDAEQAHILGQNAIQAYGLNGL